MAKLDIGRSVLGFIFVFLLPKCIVYDSKAYKPFGLRYWLGWVAWILYLPLFFLLSYLVFSPLNWKFLWTGAAWVSLVLVLVWIVFAKRLWTYLKILLNRRKDYKNLDKE